jgi:tetratricopeptide (TPR) repeat protein
VLAFLAPLLVMLITSPADRRHRARLRAAAVRDAQIGAFLWEAEEVPGTVVAERTGAIAAMSGRPVEPLRGDGALPSPAPRWVALSGGLLPATDAERALFDDPGFLQQFAPLPLKRGRAHDVDDAVWTRREPPADRAGPDYARALRAAWEARAAGDTAAASLLEEAVAHEPAGCGLARESLGLAREEAGDVAGSAALLEEARRRDPACAAARAHLADRALSVGDVARADSLVSEAFRFQRRSGELRGVRARLFALAGYPEDAEREAATAILECPRNARLIVNHGILLWRRGAHEEAREMWRRAVRADPDQLRYLGDFEDAPGDAPAPPLRPITTDVGFRPRGASAAARGGGR